MPRSGAAFGAPLTGAFYAFEIVIGAYTPAAIAPVGAACLTAVLVVRFAGIDAYLTALPGAKAITSGDYLLYAGLGIVCALIGIGIMRAVTWIEASVRRSPIPETWRPAIGGLILIPLAMLTPQSLSAGHGALHLDLGAEVGLKFILMVFLIKIAALLHLARFRVPRRLVSSHPCSSDRWSDSCSRVQPSASMECRRSIPPMRL